MSTLVSSVATFSQTGFMKDLSVESKSIQQKSNYSVFTLIQFLLVF